MLSYLLSGIVQVELPRRQALLEAETTVERLEALVRLLDREVMLLGEPASACSPRTRASSAAPGGARLADPRSGRLDADDPADRERHRGGDAAEGHLACRAEERGTPGQAADPETQHRERQEAQRAGWP